MPPQPPSVIVTRFGHFSQCRTQLLAWCLECAVVSTSLQSLKTYIGCLSVISFQRVVVKTALLVWKCVPVSLQSTSGTSAFPLHSSKAASVCDLPLLELYWFHALRQPLGSGVSPSTDLPSETVCHQHYVRQICRRTPSSGHWRRISSHLSSDIESF